nr:MAG TPA: hypothetical protein [Caudoviricetes sp.]
MRRCGYACAKSCAKAAQAGRGNPLYQAYTAAVSSGVFVCVASLFMSEDRGHPQGWPLPDRRFSTPQVLARHCGK